MKKQPSWFSRQYPGTLILLALLIIGIAIATVYLFQEANNSDRKILQLNFIALLLGLIFEYRRIAEKWSTVLWTAAGAYVLSFLAFTRGKQVDTEYLELSNNTHSVNRQLSENIRIP